MKPHGYAISNRASSGPAQRSRPSSVRRRGFTLVEMAMSTVMLAAAMTITVQLLGWMTLERRAVQRRSVAIQEAANAMEHLTSLGWEDVTDELGRTIELSTSARETLPDAELKVDVAAQGVEEGSKRVTITIRWRGRSGVLEKPVRLTSWIYQVKRGHP